MEIILKNLPETNDEVFLIIEPSLLSKSSEIIYNINEINDENKNEIILSQNKYKYNTIYTNIEKGFFSKIITNQINKKGDMSLLLILDNNQNEAEINLNNCFMNELNNLFTKEFFDKNELSQIIYNYYKINLEENNTDNIINNRIINKESESFIIDISPNEKKDNIYLLKIKFEYENNIINISSFINIYFIYNSFEKILPLFSVNKKEKEILILNEKINNLLLTEKDIKEKISKLPMINNDFIQDINIYKKEVISYFDDFVKKVDLEKKENKIKNSYNTKINLNDLIKEGKNLLELINKEEFKNKEKNIYQKYIEVYSNNNQNIFDILELKSSINTFNNLNEELLDFLEKEKNQKEIKNKDKEIISLKQKINQLEKELKEEKNKNKENKENNNNDNPQSQNKKIKQRSISTMKLNNNSNNNQINIHTLENENKKLKKNIEELKDNISKLKSKNESLMKTNEKLLKDLKEKNIPKSYDTLKNNKKAINSVYNSPKKSSNQNIEFNSSTEKKNKIMNKTKTNTDLLINGNSLLLLKKIQEENKELSKQLKDFNSKNFQLELSLKGINGTEFKNNNKNHNSLLYNFTKNTRGELKNIEKKYGLAKNK